jgi:hypothetical protein
VGQALDALDVTIAQHPRGVGQVVELDPLVLRRLDLFGVSRHVLAPPPVDDVYLLGAQAPGRACGVDGHVAAADHAHLLARQVRRIAQGDVPQKVDAVQHAVHLFALDAQLAAVVGADGEDDSRVTGE